MEKQSIYNLKFSIIIPSFNQGEFIEQTIKSVIAQNYSNFELIIVDNNSKDSTNEIIKKYKNDIHVFIQESDSGQSNAINKGFKIASGDYLTWLNSDDILLPNALLSIYNYIKRKKNSKFIFGNSIWINSENQILKIIKGENSIPIFTKNKIFAAYGPSAFIRKDIIKQYGYLREDFHYMMDTELWYRIICAELYYDRVADYVWALRIHKNAKMSGHHFPDSEYAQKNHKSHIIKKNEKDFIITRYKYANKYILILYYLYKLINLNQMKTRIQSLYFLNKDYGKFIK